MTIIKRSGVEVLFDPKKIANAVTKANQSVNEVNRMSESQIEEITTAVTKICEGMGRATSVEEVRTLWSVKSWLRVLLMWRKIILPIATHAPLSGSLTPPMRKSSV